MMSAPYGSSTGSALDVIIVVPSNNRRRRSSSTTNNNAPQSQPLNTNTARVYSNGVVASSDFFVTFPSNLAPPPNTTTSTSLRKSISKSKLYKALSSSNLSTKNTNYSRGNSRGSSTNSGSRLSSRGSSGGSETIQEELELESQDDRREEGMHAQSEHGTSSTKEPNHTQFNTCSNLAGRRKGNVQIQINGRYIPQLDMIFSSSSSNGVDGISSSSNSEPSCRFVVGNGIRPSTSTLEMLLDYDNDVDDDDGDITKQGKEQQTTPVCTCSEAIRNSDHHLCNIINKQDSNNTAISTPTATTTSQNNKQTKSILTPGRNLLRYTLHSPSNTIIASTTCHIYLWSSSDKVIISDVDGTITKSDIRGVYDTIIQDNFTYCHAGICKFFHSLVTERSNSNTADDGMREVVEEDEGHGNDGGQVQFFYLTARPIRLISQTRKLLQSLKQPCSLSKGSKMYGLPPGPILCNTGALSSVLYSELWAKNTHQFKADVCIRQVLLPFVAARGTVNDDIEGADSNNMPQRTSSGLSEASSLYSTTGSGNSERLFIAGFGNKYSDAQAYEMAGLSRKDIYIIDKESRILCMDDGTDTNCGSETMQQRLSSSSDPSGNMSITDWSMADVCCPGGVDSQLLSELSTPTTVPSTQVQESAESNNEIATSIQSIELSLTESQQSPDESSLENLTISKTSVEICNVTSDKLGKRQRFKQSIRAFSSKRTSLKKFPSFGSSPDRSKASSKKKLFCGYDDPLLLTRVRERMMI